MDDGAHDEHRGHRSPDLTSHGGHRRLQDEHAAQGPRDEPDDRSDQRGFPGADLADDDGRNQRSGNAGHDRHAREHGADDALVAARPGDDAPEQVGDEGRRDRCTPDATSVVLAVSALAIVLSAARDDLEWLAAAVGFGILLSFVAQLIRPPQREGLVLTLLASFGGLVVIASGTSAVVAANSSTGAAVAAVGGAAVAAALVADLLVPGVKGAVQDERSVGVLLTAVAVAAGLGGGLIAGDFVDDVSAVEAALIGAVVGVVSWGLRRVLVLAPAMVTVRGQVGAAVASVLVVGAVLHTAATLLT